MVTEKRIKRSWWRAVALLVALVAAGLYVHHWPLTEQVIDAVEDGDYQRVERLLHWDPFLVNVVYTTDPGQLRARPSLLTLASYHRHKKIVALLVTRGANVNWHGWGLRTALHDLAEYDDGSAMRLLLQSGADPNARDHARRTPLHLAAEAGNQRAVEVLLAHGGDANARDQEAKTPLSYAVEARQDSTALLLRSRGGKTGS